MSATVTPGQALQDALAAEHAATYLYGHLVGRTSTDRAPALAEDLRAGYVVHRARRDQVARLVRDDGRTPVAAEPAYALPVGVDTPAGARRFAADLESRCCEVYAVAVGATWGASRQWALGALLESALRAVALGATPSVWPGLPERS